MQNKKIQIWFINNHQSILVKKNLNLSKKVSIDDITITSNTLSEAIIKIEHEWGILCSKENLKLLYSADIKVNKILTNLKVYILALHLDSGSHKFIIDKYSGTFIPYKNRIKSLDFLMRHMEYPEYLRILLCNLDTNLTNFI